jgi:maltose alpha-D-glucosyltransferase/alpha-amylase
MDASDPEFTPERFTAFDRRSLYQAVRNATRGGLRTLRRIDPLGPAARQEADAVLALAEVIDRRLRQFLDTTIDGLRIRCHGDYHLGQLLFTGVDFVITDFEGEPQRTLSERRLKRSALTDVAGMIRSFHYAARGSLLLPDRAAVIRPEDAGTVDAWTRSWYAHVASAFVGGYLAATDGTGILPSSDPATAILLEVLQLQKAFYELEYELAARPDWVTLPLQGIISILGGSRARPPAIPAL